MIHEFLGSLMGLLFVLLGGLNLWVMLYSSKRKHEASLRRIHRVGGYAFVGLFACMLYLMLLRIRGAEELSAQIIFHIVLALSLIPLLIVKISIARNYRKYDSALMPLGILIFSISFVLVSMNVVTHFVGSMDPDKLPSTVPLLFFTVVGASIGYLLLRPPVKSIPVGENIKQASSSGQPRRLLRLARIEEQTHDSKTLRFVIARGKHFEAEPGQFLTFFFKIAGKDVVRSYTICSSPTQRGYVEITPKRVPHGYVSSFLNESVGVGLEVEAAGPFGQFYFKESEHERIVLIAGGSGITPMISILRYIDDLSLETPVILLYCIRTLQDVIFERALRELEARHSGFKMVIVPSQKDPNWSGPHGHISRELIASHVHDLPSSTFFLCGPPLFMQKAREILQALHVSGEKIKIEHFGVTNPTQAVEQTIGSTAPHFAEFVRSGKTVQIPPNKSLLEIAELNGVDIPSSCRQGQCGTCAIKLLDGSVDMSADVALSSDQRNSDYILACSAMPRGNVKIDS